MKEKALEEVKKFEKQKKEVEQEKEKKKKKKLKGKIKVKKKKWKKYMKNFFSQVSAGYINISSNY